MIQRCIVRAVREKIQSVGMAMLEVVKVNTGCMDLLSLWVVVTTRKRLHLLICKVHHQVIMVAHHHHHHRSYHHVPLPQHCPLHRQIQSAI